MRRFGFLQVVVLLLVVAPVVALAETGDIQDQLDVLVEEIAALREQIAVPETDADLESRFGMAPAASKVYGISPGVSVGGYGEFYFAAPIEETDLTGATNQADYYRFITYFGYKFTDSILMNTEIEFEHATTGSINGRSGSASVEFAYLDFLLHDAFNVRAGNLLVPVGRVNVTHEPPFYRGNFRPETERSIVPSTWRELGVGAHGELSPDVEYTAYVVNGLQAKGFGSSGVRGGRQKGNRAIWEDVGIVAEVRFDRDDRYGFAVSGYHGGADHNQEFGDEDDPVTFDVSNWIASSHGYLKAGPLDVRALVAVAGIEGADDLSTYLETDPEKQIAVPERQVGGYVDIAFDATDLLLGEDSEVQILPWIRYEALDLHAQMPDGVAASPQQAQQFLTAGVEVLPHPQVVLKAEYVHKTHAADSALSDEVRVGAGFIF